MSFGGSQGTIKYVLQVDDAQATQKLNTFNSSLKQVGVTSLSTGKNVATMGTQFNAGLNQIKSAGAPLAQLDKQTVSLGTRIKDTASKFGGFAIGLSATVSSALQLGASFRDFNDAQVIVERTARKLSVSQEALGKAQDKLNKLTASGVTSGKDYEQAQLDVKQAQSQVEIQTASLKNAQENLFDSQAQFVASVVPTILGAFGTMTIAMKDLGLNMTKLKGVFGSGGAAAKLFSSDLGLIGGAAGLAVTAAILIIDQLEKMKGRLKEAGVQVTQTSKSFIQAFIDMDLAKFNSEMKQSMLEFDNLNKIMRTTPWHLATTDVQTLRKEIEAAGGVFDKTGKLMQVQTDHVFELAKGFKDSSTTWIKWMTNYRLAGESQAQIMERLKKAGFDLATAQKIAAAAEENVTNKRKAGIQTTEEAAKATQTLVQAIDLTNRAAYYQTGAFRDTTDSVGSYADEFAHLEVEVTKGNKSIDLTNRAIAYQNGTFKDTAPSVASYADEFAHLEVEVNKGNIAIDLTNRALKYQEKAFPTSTIDEFAQSIDESGASVLHLAETVNHATPTLDAMRQAAAGLVDELAAFQKQSKIEIMTAFDVKTPQDRVEKMIKKFVDKLPKKYKKDIKLDLDTQAAEESFGVVAGKMIEGLSDQLSKRGDDFDDAFAKGLKNLAPKGKAGQKIRDWLDKAIAASNTGEILQNNIDKSNFTLKIPSEPDFSGFDPNSPAGFEMDLGGGAKTMSVPATPSWTKPTATTKPLEVPAKIIPIGFVDIPNTPENQKKLELAQSKIPPRNVDQTTTRVPLVPKGPFTTGAGDPFTAGAVGAQKLQKALANLANQGANSMRILGSAAKVHLNTVANYAKGATPSLQKMQTGLANLANQGSNSTRILGKAAKTNFNTVANYAVGATPSLQALQKSLANLANQGSNSMSILAKSSSKNFNAVAKNAQTAQRAIISLIKSIGNLKSKSITITITTNHVETFKTVRLQHGFHGWVNSPVQFMAGEAGPEYVSVTPMKQTAGGSNRGGSATVGSGQIIVNLTNVLADREIVRTYKRKLGENQYRFGPR